MVEGPECHRVAADHRKKLQGKQFKALSPNGRFSDGASAINTAGGVLTRIEVHGKNMFYFFGSTGGAAADEVVVRVHFGMAGEFASYSASSAPDPKPATRLRLEATDGTVIGHLSAMTVEHGGVAGLYEKVAGSLGPDPLREDDDPAPFFAHCRSASKPVCTVLLDQSRIAGVGNILRAEILYDARIHPEQPANTLSDAQLEALWARCVEHCAQCFRTGSIWDPVKGAKVYGLSKSACGGRVVHWEIGGRAVYACSKQQVRHQGAPVEGGKFSTKAAEKAAKKGSEGSAKKPKPAGATKRKRGAEAPEAEAEVVVIDGEGEATQGGEGAPKRTKGGGEGRAVTEGPMVSAVDAAEAKVKRGEGRNVQHVALKDDSTLALEAAQKRTKATAGPKAKGGKKKKAEEAAADDGTGGGPQEGALGCSKCRYAAKGCGRCRAKLAT